ncbi:hypothetical protein V8G54_002608 [Vigna mungo]|uniref:Uncharacterized protein n=1 Tax=Vigna mungo TaxID=3915 RepID=A0AAQ3SD62_VIGMU
MPEESRVTRFGQCRNRCRDETTIQKENEFRKEILEFGSRLRVGKVLAPYNACPKAEGGGLPFLRTGKLQVVGASTFVPHSKAKKRAKLTEQKPKFDHCQADGRYKKKNLRLRGPNELGLMGQRAGLIGASVETELGGQNWALGPGELGLGASVETGLRASGLVWKLGLGASVEAGLRGQASWAWWASVETEHMGQCRNWAYGPGETGLGGQCRNWALGSGELGLGASIEIELGGLKDSITIHRAVKMGHNLRANPLGLKNTTHLCAGQISTRLI